MKLGILISGRGSNMTAIVEAVQSGFIPDSEVVVVISDKTRAEGLEKAKARGIETVVVMKNARTRDEHDAEIISRIEKRNVGTRLSGRLYAAFVEGFCSRFSE